VSQRPAGLGDDPIRRRQHAQPPTAFVCPLPAALTAVDQRPPRPPLDHDSVATPTALPLGDR
jgi:hypothetical protein